MQESYDTSSNIKELRDFSNTILNQSKVITDEIKDNVVTFTKKANKQNPFNSMLYTWQLAQLRKNIVFWSTLPLVVNTTFWDVWISVYKPEGKKDEN